MFYQSLRLSRLCESYFYFFFLNTLLLKSLLNPKIKNQFCKSFSEEPEKQLPEITTINKSLHKYNVNFHLHNSRLGSRMKNSLLYIKFRHKNFKKRPSSLEMFIYEKVKKILNEGLSKPTRLLFLHIQTINRIKRSIMSHCSRG